MNSHGSIRSLSEAIILQSIEDLWDSRHKDECARFFRGEGFDICAGLAGIGLRERSELVRLVGRSVAGLVRSREMGDVRENPAG